eukprot:CAMPEP_0196571348 /NCGR_PEP_ID=MMETSP1081-20130531/1521_1 /TAXON_ID=36882 /ORGANISM="Pyramimonas amylifera, Strain CCMP720" /LENGTH=772 /DNA_ID=CAMNT_0041888251 /DNA_START=88 /DNA_END=2406 /DNA_ORIENTATION=-
MVTDDAVNLADVGSNNTLQTTTEMPVVSETSAENKVDDEDCVLPPGEEEKPPPCPTEEFWAVVRENLNDFKTWTSLIKTAEETTDLAKISKVYDAFLEEFPLCYGYWKRYADSYKASGDYEATVGVYERGVAAIPYSVDLWLHYCNYYLDLATDPSAVRSLFERGLAYVGTDFNSHPLWDKFLEFELAQGTPKHVAKIYSQTLQIPLLKLDTYWEGLVAYVGRKNVRDLMVDEELASADQQYLASLEIAPLVDSTVEVLADVPAHLAEGPEASTNASSPTEENKSSEDQNPQSLSAEESNTGSGDVTMAPAVTGEEEKEETTKAAPLVRELTPEEQASLQAQYLQARQDLYKATAAEVALRLPLESALRRPYFHVKCLKPEELDAWAAYLSHAEAAWELPSTVHLYERCVIACARYPAMWIRYANYTFKTLGAQAARSVLQRATLVHCKRSAEVNLYGARFEESQGDAEAARLYYLKALELTPHLVQGVVAFANFERRHGGVAAARGVYENALKAEKERKGEESKGKGEEYAFLALQASRFLWQRLGLVEEARAMLEEAMTLHPDSRPLLEGAVLLEGNLARTQEEEERASRGLALFERATKPPTTVSEESSEVPPASLSEEDRFELSCWAVEYADLHGTAAQLSEVLQRHRDQFGVNPNYVSSGTSTSAPASRKRSGEALDAGASKLGKSSEQTQQVSASISPTVSTTPVTAYTQQYPASAQPYAQPGYQYPQQAYQYPQQAYQYPQHYAPQYAAPYAQQYPAGYQYPAYQ